MASGVLASGSPNSLLPSLVMTKSSSTRIPPKDLNFGSGQEQEFDANGVPIGFTKDEMDEGRSCWMIGGGIKWCIDLPMLGIESL